VLPFNAKFFLGCLQLIQHQKFDFFNIKNNTANGPSQIPQEKVKKKEEKNNIYKSLSPLLYSTNCNSKCLSLFPFAIHEDHVD